MKILNLQTTDPEKVIQQTISVLQAGGLIIFPTETTYGAGVLATHPGAVAKLLAYKSRRQGKPLSIAVPDLATAEQYVAVNQQARDLFRRFLPGPVTVVCRDLGKTAPGVASEFGTLGIRVPDYPLVLDLLAKLGQPITATSANASGKKRPYTIEDILAGLSDKQKSLIDLVLDAGRLPANPPSAVIDTTTSTPIALRQGRLEAEIIDPNQPTTKLVSTSEAETKKIAGTLLLKHWDTLLETGLIIALDGPLGAGKTVFTKGVAQFLLIAETITSPTYTYLESYDWHRHGEAGSLHHLDLWKLDDTADISALGLEALTGPKQIVVIEWWQNIAKQTKLTPDIQLVMTQPNSKTATRAIWLQTHPDRENHAD